MPRTHKIYALVDPRDQEIYYIGRTSRPLHDRKDEHLTPGDNWVSKKTQAILQSGQQPHIIKLYQTQNAYTAFHLELTAIHERAARGDTLRNREAQKWFCDRYEEMVGPKPRPTTKPPAKRSRRSS